MKHFFKHLLRRFFYINLILIVCSCETTFQQEDFREALYKDDAQRMNYMLRQISVDTLKFDDGRNLMHEVVRYNAFNIYKASIKDYKLLDSIDDYGYTPLHIAILEDKEALAQIILENDIKQDVTDNEGFSPLHCAILKDYTSLAKTLIEKGANINLKTAVVGNTPLHLAIENDNADLAAFLLSKNASDTIRNTNGENARNLASHYARSEVVALFFDKLSLSEKNNILYNRIRDDSTTVIIKKWIDQDWVSKKVLQEGLVFSKYPEIAILLIEKGANVNYTSVNYGYGAIHHSAIRGDVKMLQFLIEKGANVNKVSNGNMSVLMHAASLYTETLIQQHIGGYEFKTSYALQDAFGMSFDKNPANSLEAVEFLLTTDINRNYKNKENENALFMAASTFNESVAAFLTLNGVKETKKFVETKADKNQRILEKISRDAMFKDVNYN
jgi:ankyrin repeat protein